MACVDGNVGQERRTLAAETGVRSEGILSARQSHREDLPRGCNGVSAAQRCRTPSSGQTGPTHLDPSLIQ